MPGFVGVVDWSHRVSLESFESAFSTLARPGLVAETSIDDSGAVALGRAHLNVLQPYPQLVKGRGVQVLLQGEVTNEAEVASSVDGPSGGYDSQASLVSSLYRASGVAGLAGLRGSYSIAIVDSERRQVVLGTDRLGSYPVYWASWGSRLIFGSELRALLRLDARPASLDPRAVADYVGLGLITGNRTLAAGIELVGPGCAVRWSADSGADTLSFSAMVDLFARDGRPREDYVPAVVEAFGKAIQTAVRPPGPLGMSLSGGLDSRAILSGLGPTAAETHTYTLGVAGCADAAIADRLSHLIGNPHSFCELDSQYLKDFLDQLRRMVSLTDGMYLSHGLTEMLALNYFKDAPFKVLLRGHCGELAKTRLAWPVHTDETVYTLRTTRDLVDHLLRRISHISGDVEWLDLFTEGWQAQMIDGCRASLTESLADVPLSPPELCGYLYLREHHRRFTVPSLELFRNAVEIRLPFADETFLAVLLSGAPEWRDSSELHRAIIAHYDPRLLRVRDSNTGTSVDAGPVRAFLSDKLNSLLKRLNVSGYRHYHNFDTWMAGMLVGAIESEVLSPRSLDRGMLRRERVRALIDGARRGTVGYAYLLQILLILELWQQENVDAERSTGLPQPGATTAPPQPPGAQRH